MTEWMTEVLVRAIKVERPRHLHDDFYPGEVLIRLVVIVAIAGTLGRLIVAQNSRGLFAAHLATAEASFRVVASVRQRADFAFRLNRVDAPNCIFTRHVIINGYSLRLRTYLRIYQLDKCRSSLTRLAFHFFALFRSSAKFEASSFEGAASVSSGAAA